MCSIDFQQMEWHNMNYTYSTELRLCFKHYKLLCLQYVLWDFEA